MSRDWCLAVLCRTKDLGFDRVRGKCRGGWRHGTGWGWDGGWERGQPLAQVILVFMRKQTHASLDLTHTLEVSFSDYT